MPPRNLGDVLHHLLPAAPEAPARLGRPEAAGPQTRSPIAEGPGRPAALPVLALPIGERDVLRSALAWNLCVEVARLGGRVVLAAPEAPENAALLPPAGVGPMGAEVVISDARDLSALHRDALDLAVERSVEAPEGGLVLVRVPPRWLCSGKACNPRAGNALLRWSLLFTSSERSDLMETYGLAKLVLAAREGARVGVTVHGVRSIADAEQAFLRLARSAERHLARPLSSYGLLVDDLHVYRAIVARRPIGLAHPQSPAARALRDVAQLMLDDAREMAVV